MERDFKGPDLRIVHRNESHEVKNTPFRPDLGLIHREEFGGLFEENVRVFLDSAAGVGESFEGMTGINHQSIEAAQAALNYHKLRLSEMEDLLKSLAQNLKDE